MNRAPALWVVALLAGCAATRGPEGRLTELEERYQSDEERVVDLVAAYPRLRGDAAILIDLHRQSAEALTAARLAWNDTAQRSDATASELRAAEADSRAAIRNYRIATAALVIMATGQNVCASTETTAQLRAQLRRDGLDLTGVDVDHMFPKSLGGLDHPLNYQLLDASLNRSLGNDLLRKFMQAPLGVLQGALVSVLGKLGGC